MLWLLPSSRGWLAFLLVLVISARTMAFLPDTVSLVPLMTVLVSTAYH